MSPVYECRGLADLTESDLEVWQRLQRDQPVLDQPFLAREFATAAHQFCAPVEVVLVRQGGRTVGLIPFQRRGRRRAVPIADGMNEYQSFLLDDSVTVQPKDWMSAAKLSEFGFDHIALDNASELRQQAHTVGPCPFADLSQGFDAYCENLKQRGSRTVRETQRKRRKLARELGDTRFELRSDCEEGFDALVRWKQAQHQRTNVYDTFAHDSVVEFLRHVWQTRTSGFSGFLCTLHAGDSLVAVHLGIRTKRVAHMWFPAYDRELQNYSPGLVMLLEMSEALAEDGIERLDFGPGPQRYKRSLATGSYDVGIGEITANSCSRWLKQTWRSARQSLKNHGAANWLKSPTKWIHPFRQKQTLDSSSHS